MTQKYTATCIATLPRAHRPFGSPPRRQEERPAADPGVFDRAALPTSPRCSGPSIEFVVGCFRSPRIADADGLYTRCTPGGSANVMGCSNKKVDQMQGHVQFPDTAERLCQTSDLALGLPGLAVVQPFGQHRDRLPQAPGRDPCLMDTGVFSRDGRGELSAQRSGATLEETDQGKRTVHGRMRPVRPNGQYITLM